ncbi:MAG: FAD-dependent oxidoreductase [Acidimicrobiales bacterium]
MTAPLSSLWTNSHDGAPSVGRPPLSGDRRADVVVVGAGAAGLSIALRLQESGADVVVLERHTVGGGVTGGSTAKVTALHGVQSSAIERQHGSDAATAYLTANREALDDIRATIDRYGIACELTSAAAINYATSPAGRARLDDELTTTRAAGLATELHDDAQLPFPVEAALLLPDQAHLHPVRWCRGLAEALRPGAIHEQTPVVRVDEDAGSCIAATPSGSVQAEHVVIATQTPIVDPRYLAVRCRPHRSYVVAARIDGPLASDMYLSVDEPVRSLRPAQADGASYLVVAGEGHPVADERDAGDCLATLEAWTRERFPVVSIENRWAAHDQMPADHLPFIGRLTPGSNRWVATGFQKWGLTTSAVAATIIGEGIAGRGHRAAEVFDPTRLRSTMTGQLACDVGRVASRYVGDHVRLLGPDRHATARSLDALTTGDGVVMRIGRQRAAIHRDLDGRLHAVSAACTHEGCLVRFNRAQTSWDCPCHGSRFAVDGEVLCGPAVDPLRRVDVSQPADPS